ncbi:hypothetical protein KIN20_030419 [Parelaphostrongylus tenuis]|uniref:Uncharacterized protein n=1 Tax=Parelaphostrongylus tenuis TaxID=148309 RepID=A0AAD5R3Y8_PARTN|nr:hypothetical protein KIN20_030419 [Parelaphostrongylus tenuis]
MKLLRKWKIYINEYKKSGICTALFKRNFLWASSLQKMEQLSLSVTFMIDLHETTEKPKSVVKPMVKDPPLTGSAQKTTARASPGRASKETVLAKNDDLDTRTTLRSPPNEADKLRVKMALTVRCGLTVGSVHTHIARIDWATQKKCPSGMSSHGRILQCQWCPEGTDVRGFDFVH